jgi:SOS-response transcriptional repressor LexA
MSWNERLRRLVKEKGLSKAELARRSGVPYDNVNKYLRGDVENPRGDALEKLARALDTSTLYLQSGLTDRKPLPSRGVPFRGEVAAGVWIEVGEGQEVPDDYLPFNPLPQYPEGAVYCLTVRGDSLDKVAPPGTVLVCVDLYSSGIDIKDGDLVIVERAKFQDGLLEMTAKRVRAVKGGFELYPESTNPKWKPIAYPRAPNSDGESIRILARVDYVLSRP